MRSLRNSRDFSRVLRNGTKAATSTVIIHSLPTQDGAVGLIVSKTVGNAVVRNKIRRRIKEILRTEHCQFLTDHQVVVRALPRAASQDFLQLSHDISLAIHKQKKIP